MSRPNRHPVLVSAIVVLGLLIGSAACGQPDWAGPKADEKTDDATTVPAGDDDDECSDEADDDDTAAADTGGESADEGGDTGAVPDGAGEACCEDKLPGKAHCYSDVSAESQAKLDKCEGGGFCIPDAKKAHIPGKSCDTAFGPGACVSTCVKSVRDQASLIQQGSCSKNELCAPCTDPRTGKPTGSCEEAKSLVKTKANKPCMKKKATTPSPTGSGTTTKPTNPPAGDAPATGDTPPATGDGKCCGGKGICVPSSKPSDKEKEQLEQKECTTDQLCAPAENIPDSFKPKTCKGSALTGDFTGVCLSTCLVFGTFQKLASDQGDCDADHRCMPCEFPVVGGATGAPGCE